MAPLTSGLVSREPAGLVVCTHQLASRPLIMAASEPWLLLPECPASLLSPEPAPCWRDHGCRPPT